jgi:DivIVA domain-containing protein
MTDSSGPFNHPASSQAREVRLTPEAIADRGFTQAKRGYSESEVRTFLRMVSDDLMTMLARERELAARVQELEARLARPASPPSDQDLIVALGEETARVLSHARDAASELRAKADEHARRLVREAQESARELRASTQRAVETRTREAEDAARTRARELVAEARTMRERVLTDLSERRADLERQISELRSGRGKLIEVYEVVERALVQATRTMAEEPPVVASAPAGVGESEPEADETTPGVPSGSHEADVDVEAEAEVDVGTDAGAGHDDGRDVGALFQKLRSEAGVAGEPEQEPAEAEEPEPESEPLEVSDALVAGVEESVDEGVDQDGEAEALDEPLDPDQVLMAARDAALETIADDLAHRAKRAVQDEQNDVLDGLRRQRGKIDVASVLPPTADQLSRWAHVLQPSVDGAYAAGVASISPASISSASSAGEGPAVPAALLAELTDILVAPLRSRLEASLETIDARTPADVEIAVAQRLGARYREWRGQDLEDSLADVLAIAYARGVYDSAPSGSRLRWVPARVGKCPDCDDNALEPTLRGDKFPTGQQYPPAHPGCRCLVVPTIDG